MKRLSLFFVSCLSTILLFAQSSVDEKYGVGKVPTDNNGKVIFSSTIPLNGKSETDCFKLLSTWTKGRFAGPDINKAKIVEEDSEKGTISINVTETIVFKKTSLITDVTKINYTFNAAIIDNSLSISMTNIDYVYEEEREGGGSKFTAEEWITDDESFNKSKTKFLKTAGKFRIKTIDLYEEIELGVKDLFK